MPGATEAPFKRTQVTDTFQDHIVRTETDSGFPISLLWKNAAVKQKKVIW